MRVVVIGATGAIGRAVVEEAVAVGHDVVAFARDPAKLASLGRAITPAAGDALDSGALERAIAGADAVINALGPTGRGRDEVRKAETIAHDLVAAMRGAGVRRLVSVSGAAVTVHGERKPFSGRIASALVRLAVPNVVAAKQREYEILSESDLDWTAVRPPRVVDGPATGKTRAGDRLAGRTIAPGDLARFMVAQVADTTYLRMAPYVSG
jgi:putative NADH-flavin reductase